MASLHRGIEPRAMRFFCLKTHYVTNTPMETALSFLIHHSQNLIFIPFFLVFFKFKKKILPHAGLEPATFRFSRRP